jgi:predicted nucleic acid-binding protein
MIAADTSALVSLAAIDTLDLVLDEYDLHTTETVVRELEQTSEQAAAAGSVLDRLAKFTVHEVSGHFETSRIDEGEASVAKLTRKTDADFLLTDDLRALPELESATPAQVAISPFVLDALVKRGVLEREEARERLGRLAQNRDWLGSPIYRRAQELLEG